MEIKEWKPDEIIGSENKDDYLTDYQYGVSKEPLDANVALRNLPGWSNVAVGNFSFNATGNLSVTWLWFTPKCVQFQFCDLSAGWYGQGAMSASSQYAFDVISSKTQITTQCIYVRNAGWTAVWRAVYVSMDSDGFTINVTVAGDTIYVWYVAIG